MGSHGGALAVRYSPVKIPRRVLTVVTKEAGISRTEPLVIEMA